MNTEIYQKQGLSKQLSNMSSSKYYIMGNGSQKRFNSQNKSTSKSKDRTPNLSQEKIKKRENGKEKIVTFIAKYIQRSNDIEIDQDYDEAIVNLKDFLTYLENKNIINGEQLEDKSEVNNLINDLMKLDLSKFQKLKRTELKRKRKTSSRNINVSVNRSTSLNHQNQRSNSNSHSIARKVQSVNSKNVYKVCVTDHDKENRDEFKSSRKLSFLQDKEGNLNRHANSNNKYQALSDVNSNQKQSVSNNNLSKPMTLSGNLPMTPFVEKTNYGSNKHDNSHRGKTAPSSAHHSKERKSNADIISGQALLKEKLQNHNKSNSAQNTNPPAVVQNPSSQHPKMTKHTSNIINLANGLPKRSESQKSQDQERPHFSKRKDCISSVENQKEDISQALKVNKIQSESHIRNQNQNQNCGSKKPRNASNDAFKLYNSEKSCPVVETGVDKVTFNVKLKDDILSERERMIKAIKVYIRKHKRLPPTTLDYYHFIKLVGKGAFGKVTLGVHKLTGKQVAIKTIEKAYMKDEFSRKKVLQEVYILKNVKHSNVIRLLEVFESPKNLLIVMEYSGGGDLLKYIKRHGKLSEQKAREYFIQIVHGLGNCHCRSVLHRDVKLDNMLLDGEGGLKLCDFGVSKIVKKGQEINEQ